MTWRSVIGTGGVLLLAGLMAMRADAAEPLTTAAAVRELLPAQAATKLPVRLHGVVTYFRSTALPDFVLQDATGGVHVRQAPSTAQLPATMVEPGDEVEIEGVTDAAVYAPRVDLRTIRRLGHGALPAPIPATVEALQAGYNEGSLVEADGVVRAAYIDPTIAPPRLVLRLATPAGSIDAIVVRYDPTDAGRFVDAGVRLRGVPLRLQNRRSEPFRWILFVHAVADVAIVEPPPADPFAAPPRHIDEVLAGGPQLSRHRMRVRGIVTLAGDLLVVQDGDVGLRVRSREPLAAVAGDEVEVAGFARLGGYNPVLEEALVRVVGHPGAIAPETPLLAKLKPRELADRDGRLIALDGTVIGFTSLADDRWGFSLRVGKRTVPVLLPTGAKLPTAVESGAEVHVVGVCDLVPGIDVVLLSEHPTSFSLLVPSADEVTVLRAAPWWNQQRLLAVLASVGAALAVALAWAITLRRRVEQRSRQLTVEIQARRDAEVEFAATMAERRRLAAELHDTMEQGLTGVALQLEAAALGLGGPQPPPLALARQLLDHSRAEVRRSVWDLNSQSAEGGDLPAAIAAIAEQARAGRAAAVTMAVTGAPVPLPAVVVHHLVRIAQESVHNALRHGGARAVTITIAYGAGTLVLTIADDGGGFDPATAAGPQDGHFGLQNLRERASRLGGTMEIVSKSGSGTRIVTTIPLPPAPPAGAATGIAP